jgi:hypothetical protein
MKSRFHDLEGRKITHKMMLKQLEKLVWTPLLGKAPELEPFSPEQVYCREDNTIGNTEQNRREGFHFLYRCY